MPSLKICKTIEDLVCENCVYCQDKGCSLLCTLYPPSSNNYNIVNNRVPVGHTCGHGQWYCKLHRSNEDPIGPSIMHRCCGKISAVSSFLDDIRERTDETKINFSANPSDSFSIVEALRKTDIDWGKKRVMLENIRIIPKTIFKTDVTVEFTVKADIWRTK
jgi:hypothetical protein